MVSMSSMVDNAAKHLKSKRNVLSMCTVYLILPKKRHALTLRGAILRNELCLAVAPAVVALLSAFRWPSLAKRVADCRLPGCDWLE